LLAEARAREAAAGGPGAGAFTSATDVLLRERGSLASSHSMIDEVLGRAAEAQGALGRQRATIAASVFRLGGIADRLPVVSQLMRAITRRRTKNDIITALVLGGLACFTVWWLLLR
jgi:golgi SNAP receptor complex member 1